MLVQFLSLFYWIYLFPVSAAPMFITAICLFLPFPFSLLPPCLREHYYSGCPRCGGCRCTQFNFSLLLQCEGGRKGGRVQVQWGTGEKDVRGWEVCVVVHSRLTDSKTASKVGIVRLKKAVTLEPIWVNMLCGTTSSLGLNCWLVVLLLWSQAHHSVCPET